VTVAVVVAGTVVVAASVVIAGSVIARSVIAWSVIAGSVIAGPVVVARRLRRRRSGCLRRGRSGCSIEDLVEFTPVEPNTSTLRAEVDLHALSRGDGQRDVTNWALHP